MTESYLKTNQQYDVLVSLNEFVRQLERVGSNPQSWKFAIISLMFTINASLVCFLSGTMQIGALRAENVKKMREAMQKDSISSRPEPFLATPEILLKRAIGETERFDTVSHVLDVSEEQITSFKLILEFRNRFAHFSPNSWIIELTGLPKRCLDCLRNRSGGV